MQLERRPLAGGRPRAMASSAAATAATGRLLEAVDDGTSAGYSDFLPKSI